MYLIYTYLFEIQSVYGDFMAQARIHVRVTANSIHSTSI